LFDPPESSAFESRLSRPPEVYTIGVPLNQSWKVIGGNISDVPSVNSRVGVTVDFPFPFEPAMENPMRATGVSNTIVPFVFPASSRSAFLPAAGSM
jgi:hypothetical protein